MISVVIAHDQALVRAGLASLLTTTPDIAVVGEASDGDEAIAVARATRPNVLLIDAAVLGIDGIEAARRIAVDPDLSAVHVILLTTDVDDDDRVFAALRAGVRGVLTNDVEPEALRAAVRIVADGQAVLTPTVTRRVVDAFATSCVPVADGTLVKGLSEREREVLALVGGGLSNQEIAARLYMSALTAKTHVSRIMQKVGARNRAELVVIAFQSGLTRIGDARVLRMEQRVNLPAADDILLARPYRRIHDHAGLVGAAQG